MVRKNDEKQSGFLDGSQKVPPPQNEYTINNPAKVSDNPIQNNEDIIIERELVTIFRKYDTKKIIKALSRILAKP